MIETHSLSDKMPNASSSYWRESTKMDGYPKLTGDVTVEVAVVGGGIAGITSAYLLAKEGKRVALIDEGSILGGTTGFTTAKITAQHGLIYQFLFARLSTFVTGMLT